MFDEKSNVWIKIYKGITVALFFLIPVSGMIYGIRFAKAASMDLPDAILTVLGRLILGFLIGGVLLVVNMLIIQLLNNVQLIREKLDESLENTENNTLKMNSFGDCILGKYDLFEYNFGEVYQKYPGKTDKSPDIYCAKFSWSWKEYSGKGVIEFSKSRMRVCFTSSENSSFMTATTYLGEKTNETLTSSIRYDSSLLVLFNKMLNTETP